MKKPALSDLGCGYFPPGPWLPSQLQCIIAHCPNHAVRLLRQINLPMVITRQCNFAYKKIRCEKDHIWLYRFIDESMSLYSAEGAGWIVCISVICCCPIIPSVGALTYCVSHWGHTSSCDRCICMLYHLIQYPVVFALLNIFLLVREIRKCTGAMWYQYLRSMGAPRDLHSLLLSRGVWARSRGCSFPSSPCGWGVKLYSLTHSFDARCSMQTYRCPSQTCWIFTPYCVSFYSFSVPVRVGGWVDLSTQQVINMLKVACELPAVRFEPATWKLWVRYSNHLTTCT